MTQPAGLRCFDCGAEYPAGATQETAQLAFCEADSGVLAPAVLGRRWRLEGVLGPRVGGAVFIAYHLITGRRAAVSLVHTGAHRRYETRLQAEIAAHRLMEPHPNIFTLLELGSERGGIRFFVTLLNAESMLHSILRERIHVAVPMQAFSQALSLIFPIAKLLVAAHRISVAHGSLDTTQLFVNVTEHTDPDQLILSGPRIYGLQRIDQPSDLSTAAAADLLALGRMVYQLTFGSPALGAVGPKQQRAVLRVMGPVAGGFLLRALSNQTDGDWPRFAHVEELTRAIVTVRSELSSDEHAPVTPWDEDEPMGGSTQTQRTQTSSIRSIPALHSEHLLVPRETSGLLPIALQGACTPNPSSLSKELQTTSFADLLSGREQSGPVHILARSRLRPSLTEGRSPHREGRPSLRSLEVELEISEPAEEPITAERAAPTFFEEPTLDIRTRIVNPALLNQ